MDEYGSDFHKLIKKETDELCIAHTGYVCAGWSTTMNTEKISKQRMIQDSNLIRFILDEDYRHCTYAHAMSLLNEPSTYENMSLYRDDMNKYMLDYIFNCTEHKITRSRIDDLGVSFVPCNKGCD